MRYRRTVTAGAALLLLSGCGAGGGGEGGGAAPVSAPPAAVAPSPAPTPAAPPVAAAPAHARYSRVVYVGNDVPDLVAYEAWLGHPADGVQLHSGRAGWAGWADWSSSITWLIDRWKGVDRPIFWSIPLFAAEGDLAAAAAGSYNARYTAAATALAAAYPNAERIHVRTGWEFNGDWQPWAARGREADYRGAFRQFVASFRAVSGRFVFEWAPNVGDQGMNPEDAYPGDDVVDVIGLDFYYNHQWDAADATAAWNGRVTERYGLAWHQAFATRHGKPTAYSEWGVSGNADAPFVAAAAAWFAAHDVVYASYWNSNAGYPGKLSDEQYPAVSAAYRALAAE